jgi:hypothetical protein
MVYLPQPAHQTRHSIRMRNIPSCENVSWSRARSDDCQMSEAQVDCVGIYASLNLGSQAAAET